MPTADTLEDGKITCRIDNARVHSIQLHIKKVHPSWSVERYQTEYPGEPLMSDMAKEIVRKKNAEKAQIVSDAKAAEFRSMAELFNLPSNQVKNARGEPIMVSLVPSSELDEDDVAYLSDVDPRYVFNIELTKTALIALELNMPGYFWGYHGTGKTTCWEQVCARTGRPFMRVQHTINTEESHILGQYTIRDGATIFNLGPLPTAMLKGYVYCADEYDIAMPSVAAVYQPVLEGKALLIKDAPPEMRVIRPHRNFRFVATGNTNGCGDETGLYQGTQIQNAANYSRFQVTEEVGYMEPKIEQVVISSQSGAHADEASKLVAFATEWRKSFANGVVSATVSPRELIGAAGLGLVRGGDWTGGLKLAFINRLSRTDKEVALQLAQRLFGR